MTRRLLLSYLTLTVCVLLALELPLGLIWASFERRRVVDRASALAIGVGAAVDEQLGLVLPREVPASAFCVGFCRVR